MEGGGPNLNCQMPYVMHLNEMYENEMGMLENLRGECNNMQIPGQSREREVFGVL